MTKKTTEDLKAAFAGEAQANRRYLAFAKKAESEGKKGIAKLFRVAAEGETVHALNHLRAMHGVEDTAENLRQAVAGETYESEDMYPAFLKDAEEEGEKAAIVSFSGALAVEKLHKKFFEEALLKELANEEVPDADFYVCTVCGFPASPEAPDACPVCGARKELFRKVE